MGKKIALGSWLSLPGTPPKWFPTFVPRSLPSGPFFTLNGWKEFDDLGRIGKCKEQPDPPKSWSLVFVPCTYAEVRKRWPLLPAVPKPKSKRGQERVKKENQRAANEFFLTNGEKRDLERKRLCKKIQRGVQARKKKRSAAKHIVGRGVGFGDEGWDFQNSNYQAILAREMAVAGVEAKAQASVKPEPENEDEFEWKAETAPPKRVMSCDMPSLDDSPSDEEFWNELETKWHAVKSDSK